ncbi:MAG: SAM-dependent methyltransferase [Ruminococcaceae bacterium]|nr:SAM-dependent methyltransferase [Oscillospiraceae bacterium]
MTCEKIILFCLKEKSRNPLEILEKLMSSPSCPMHGPIHHFLVGASLLTAYKNAGGELDLPSALKEMYSRSSLVPGGACGNWGACGGAISTGMFVSIVTGASPLSMESWGLANRMTAAALNAIGNVNGPRCCKRDCCLAILSAVKFCRDNLGINMESHTVKCSRSAQNKQCIGTRCPFYKTGA